MAEIDRILEAEGYGPEARALALRRLARTLQELDVAAGVGRPLKQLEKQRVRTLLEGGSPTSDIIDRLKG